jgi:hypothetical protein
MGLNKISVKQQGGQMIPNQPGMQQQPQVDPAIQQVSVFFKESIEQGGKPEEVVMALIQQEVDQNTIVQALMSLGYQENDLQVLFQNIQKQQQPSDPTAQQINQDPQQLARQQEIEEDQEGLNVNIDPVEIAKSGIEIKPENEGKFTAWAKARGMGVQEAAKKVMANKDRYPTRIVKMANFAKNAAGWNKAQDGVEIQKLSPDGRSIITERDGMTILKDNPWDNQDAKSQLQDIETQIKLLQQQAAIAKAQAQYNAKKALLNEQKEGGEFKPHFMYKGKRKLRAKDMETHLRLKEAGYTHDVPKAQTGGQDVVNDNDDGIINNPFYISPSAFHTGKRFSPASLVNSVVDFGTTLFGGQDKDNDGLKDGSLRDLKNKTIANKAKKYADADYTVNLDLSDENITNFQNWMTQYQKENPTLKDAISNLPTPNVETNKPEINNVVEQGKNWLNENITDLGESAQSLYDAVKNKISGTNPKKQSGNGESTSDEADAELDSDALFNKINFGSVDVDTGGVFGALKRGYDSNAMRAFEDIAGKGIGVISNINDFMEDADDSGYVDARQNIVADNVYATKTDAQFKRGKGHDINTGLFGSDADRVTGYYMKNGGTNNPGFKALPKSVQANILQNMQGGGTPGQQIPGMPTKAQLDAVTGANKIQFAPRTPQYEYLASLPEQSVDFQLPNFVKDSSYNEMLVTRLFKDSELMKLPSQSENFQLDNFVKMQTGGTPGKQIPGTPTKEELDLLVYLNKFNKGFMADGYKPSQEEFDKMTQEERELYSESFPQNYKIGRDTPSTLDLYKLNYSNSFMANDSRPNQSEFDTMSQSQKKTYAESFPGFYKISSDTPTKEELDAITNKMEMGGNPFNPLKLFTDDLEEYQKKGETPVRPRRSRSEIESEIAELQRQIDSENSRIEGFRSNIDKIYRGILTSKEVDDEQQRKNELAKILGDDSSINPNIFRRNEYNVVGLDTVPSQTRNWLQSRMDSGQAGYGCTSYGCGILRQAGATTAEGKPFPIISGNSQLNSMIESNKGGLGMQLMEPGFSDLLPGDRVVSNYSTSGESGQAHTMIFTGDYDENGSPIMMENSGGNVSGGVSYRPLSSIKGYDNTSDPNSGLRVTRYVGSTSDLNNQLSALQSDIDTGNYLVTPLTTFLNPAPISMSEISLPKAELLPMNNYGGERGEAAYLANRDKIIKREMAKAQQGGEIINVDPKMLAKLIAAGADIEIL